MAPTPTDLQRILGAAALLAGASFMALAAMPAAAATPTDLLNGYRAAAGGAAPAADRGQQLFTLTHGREWSCASCHGATPTATGKHANTGKPIAPLAPAFNAERFADAAKAEKWFRRNCNDVIGRECSAAEKADVLAWLMSLKP
jgi:mono/diheme cytochrome c family protein